jgi:hypothetical protein
LVIPQTSIGFQTAGYRKEIVMALRTALIKEFILLLGTENVFTSEADRMAYSYDEAVLTPVVPALVVRPMEEKLLGKAVNLAYENDLPITVRGSGTNLMVYASEFPIRQSRRLRKQDS